jgi:hypothetical protein
MTSIIPFLTLLLAPDLGQTSAVNAIAVLDRALQAHGGLAALQKIADIRRYRRAVSALMRRDRT